MSDRLTLGRRRRPPVADRAGASTWTGAAAAGEPRPAQEEEAGPRHQAPQAGNPGEDAPRPWIFCPVPGCPESDPQRAAGWQSNAALRPHLNDHGAGRCVGAVPATYLAEQRLDQCQVCSRFLAARYGGTCPRCRPQLAVPAAGVEEGRPRGPDAPPLEDLFSKRVATKAFVPKAARRLWAHCLVQSLAQVAWYNDECAWAEFYMLPKSVLRASARGGRCKKDGEAETKALCQRWLDGQRSQLWHQSRESRGRRRGGGDDDAAVMRATALLEQGQLQKACSALTQQPPAPMTQEVYEEMVRKHPAERSPIDWTSLCRVHPTAAPQINAETVREVLRSFPKGSAGGLTGLKPQHLRDAHTHTHLRTRTSCIVILPRS